MLRYFALYRDVPPADKYRSDRSAPIVVKQIANSGNFQISWRICGKAEAPADFENWLEIPAVQRPGDGPGMPRLRVTNASTAVNSFRRSGPRMTE